MKYLQVALLIVVALAGTAFRSSGHAEPAGAAAPYGASARLK